INLAEVKEGHKLYKIHCGSCHGLIKPTEKSSTEWRKIVPIMAKKVNKKYAGALSSQNQNKILQYLLVMQGQ
ncbi:MAG: c-type cytochrome, partial [Bacteroidia bacterium]